MTILPSGSAVPNPSGEPAPPARLSLRPREAARALGISERTLWQLTRDGRVPCVRLGSGKRKTVLYPVAELQSWLTRQSEAANGGAA
jgi:excisionase family DNA binding protein